MPPCGCSLVSLAVSPSLRPTSYQVPRTGEQHGTVAVPTCPPISLQVVWKAILDLKTAGDSVPYVLRPMRCLKKVTSAVMLLSATSVEMLLVEMSEIRTRHRGVRATYCASRTQVSGWRNILHAILTANPPALAN